MDKTITCSCGRDFIFSQEDQDFFLSKGFVDPKRCHQCRLVRKELKFGNQESSAHYSINPQSRLSSHELPKERSFHTSSQVKKVCVATTCTLCGLPTTVPFEPHPNRAVYCGDCLKVKPQRNSL